ncbi:hypothetical protein DXG03_008838 [Asterophora parasitica]|uniref:Uncharacterized protein n=1 Tax=Asterophora parasitica TaxID=117018 RepID=A0A9P7G635_9AGAR|nr:hypothetical protein DXG03_008838 [Asterophora parasitica]
MAAVATAVVRDGPKILVHPPASPFAELLRRSKFASYDPAIRQTYSAAPAHAHRGDWGLKRPIALRRKNAFISLTSFEHPAHFTEWNHAENQVRFIRRVEEMGTRPETAVGTPWYKSLGKARTELLLDSDFCPGESGQLKLRREETIEEANTEEVDAKPTTVNLNLLGNKGPGAYGSQRAELPIEKKKRKKWDPMAVYVTANVDAMSKREFARYLAHLRTLHPAFQAHIDSEDSIREKSLYRLAQNADNGYHRKFMMDHMTGEYQNLLGGRLEPQPHPNAALTYARRTALESRLWTKPQPGIVLNTHTDRTGSAEKKYVAAFGGLGALLRHNNASGKVPLLDVSSEEGVDQARVDESIADMRVVPRHGLKLQVPPKVVGSKPQGLKAVSILAEVMTEVKGTQFSQDNPHPLGSAQYVAQAPPTTKSSPKNLAAPRHTPHRARNFVPLRRQNPEKLIATLQGMTKLRGKPVRDDEL